MIATLSGESKEIDGTVPEENKDGLEYVSKSRLKTYKTCPREFFLKYWCDNRGPETIPMARGSEIHRIYEEYHENLIEHVEETGEFPEERWKLLPDDATLEYMTPFFGNFWRFEERRRREAESLQDYLPLSVEEEGWLEDPPIGDIPWMGYADAIIKSHTLPGFDGDGVVILDYKTGKVPDEKYREEGIYLEQEFYAELFEDKYDVDGVAAYYPKTDVLLESDLSHERRLDVYQTVLGMQKEPVKENYPIKEQPLCNYGHGECFFYNNGCSSRWGKQGGPGPTYE